jgi:hypothetical protein
LHWAKRLQFTSEEKDGERAWLDLRELGQRWLARRIEQQSAAIALDRTRFFARMPPLIHGEPIDEESIARRGAGVRLGRSERLRHDRQLWR